MAGDGNSSLRNAHHRRDHKERGQLTSRRALGFLEKHSDYVKRARDWHSKQDRLQRLKEKAATRNEDEFYFAMLRKKTQNGVHIADRDSSTVLTNDMVRVLKTQDSGYMHAVRAMTRTQIKKLSAQLGALTNLKDLQSPAFRKEIGIREGAWQTLLDFGLLRDDAVPSTSKRDQAMPRKGKTIFISEEDREMDLNSTETDLAPSEKPDSDWILTAPKHRHRRKTSEVANEETSAQTSVDSQKNTVKLVRELASKIKRLAAINESLVHLEDQRERMKNGQPRTRQANAEDDDDRRSEPRTKSRKDFKKKFERKR